MAELPFVVESWALSKDTLRWRGWTLPRGINDEDDAAAAATAAAREAGSVSLPSLFRLTSSPE